MVEQGHQSDHSCWNCKANLHNLRYNYDIFSRPFHMFFKVKNSVILTVVNVCCSVTQPCLTLWDAMNLSTQGFPVFHCLPEFAQTHAYRVSDAIHPFVPCHPLLLLSSIFPSSKVLSNESALHIRWPKFLSFGFNITPSNEYSELISLGFTHCKCLEK